MSTFSEHLRDRFDETLVTLMLRRPDLANPTPTTLASLAARATSRVSIERAISRLDAFAIQVLEAVVVVDDLGRPVTPDSLADALDAPRPDVATVLDHATDLALLWHPRTGSPELRPAPGLADALGPFPGGLGPVVATSVPEGTGWLSDVLTTAPTGAREVLAALTWGPPVGHTSPDRTSTSARAAAWLVQRGLLIAQDAHTVVLPRHVGLALRGGRTHPVALVDPPRADGPARDAHVVDAESARAAEEIVRLVTVLIRTWERTPSPVLRSGGLGVRELRRLAQQLEVDDATASLVAELAQSAGLVLDDGEAVPMFAPTVAVDDWLAAELPEQWAHLARTWVRSDRTAWASSVRGTRGSQPSALDPELHRPWAARLRRVVLEVLADAPRGDEVRALDADGVITVLTWRTPRAIPSADAVAAVLAEAALVGVTGAGALGTPGLALLAELQDERAAGVEPVSPAAPSGDLGVAPRRLTLSGPGRRTAGRADATLADLLAPPVDDLVLQGDLTGIVPGRPTPALAHLLDCLAQVESRGAALTVRFTADTVRRALDDGRGADEVLADLANHSRTPVPQALDYLIRDAARTHGRLRVGAATSYIRAEDPMLLAGVAQNPVFARLGVVRLAPTVLACQADPSTVLEALRVHGLSPSAEGSDGQVVLGRPTVRRVRGDRRRPGTEPDAVAEVVREAAGARKARLSALIPRLRGADRAAQADRSLQSRAAAAAAAAEPDDGGTQDPAVALGTLREAVAGRHEVWIEIVGPAGTPTRRRVRPVTVEGGRVRAIDVERESELTIAVHRIASVSLIDAEDHATA
ncbi:MAG TPA: helicase-associated domain-containing protein [Cellulomonadaceae bacterium]|nr:helicase-associated domain-containing protein [Cellulomonadaceae bacterium]